MSASFLAEPSRPARRASAHASRLFAAFFFLCLPGALAPAAAQEAPPALRGDADGDGAVTAADASLILAHVVGRPIPAGTRTGRAMDADGNGRVSSLDALVIQRFAAGADVSAYPVGRPLATLALAPDTALLPPGGTLALRTEVRGAEDTTALWESDAPEVATVDASGVVSARAPGAATITAVLRADTTQRAAAVVRVAAGADLLAASTGEAGPAAVLTNLAGSGGSDTVRSSRTLRVRIADAAGNPVAGTEVTWQQLMGGGTFQPAVSVSGADGIAETVLTLGPRALTQIVRGVAPGLAGSPAVFSIVALPGAPARLAMAVQPPAQARLGVALEPAPAVRVQDGWGNTVKQAGIEVTVQVEAGGGGLAGAAAALTDTAGVARFPGISFTGPLGPRTLAFSSAGVASVVSGAAQVTAGLPAALEKTAGDGQAGLASAPLPQAPTVRVADAGGNPVAGVAVAFAADAGSGSVAVPLATTGADGTASAGSWTLGATPGANTLTASVAGAAPVAFTAQGAVGAAARIVSVSGGGGSDTVRAPRTLRVRITDAAGNPVAGTEVTWQQLMGGGTFQPAVSVSGADGIAETVLTLGTRALTQIVRGLAPGLAGSPAVFSIVALPGAPAQIAVATQPSSAARAGVPLETQPAVRVVDTWGNRVRAGVEVTASIATGGGTLDGPATALTDSTGVARFSGLALSGPVGARTLAFSAAGVAPVSSAAVQVAAGLPAALEKTAGDGQAGQREAPVPVPPAVRVLDAGGNPVPGVEVAFSVAAGGGSVAGASQTTGADGTATVGGWTLGPQAGEQLLAATVQGLAPVSFTAVAPGAAARLTAPEMGPGADTVRSPRTLRVRVVDAEGRPVAGTEITWQQLMGGGTFEPAVSVSNADGIAETVLTLGTRALTQIVRGVAPGLAGSPVVFSLPVFAGAPVRLAMLAQPSSSARSGEALEAQPAVRLQDTWANAVKQAGVEVTASLATGGGTLGGPVTALTDTAGVARFTGLVITGAAGTRTFAFTNPGLLPTASAPVLLTSGASASLAAQAGQAQSAPSGTAVATPPSVIVRDAGGAPVQGAQVAFAVTAGGGTVENAAQATGADGVATAGAWTLGAPGQNVLTATVDGIPALTFTALATAPLATELSALAGDGGTEAVGGARTVRVRVLDAGGDPVAGTAVSWTVTAGGGTVSAPSSATGDDGTAEVTWTAGPSPGPQGLAASAAGAEPDQVTFAFTAVPAVDGGVIDARADFGAQADGSDDEPEIQAALDAARDAGGGVVRLPAGTYRIARPLLVGSGVHLTGDGRGVTVLRPLGASYPAKVVNGAQVYSSVAMVAVTDASVSNLTIDHATTGTSANGVSMLPDGAEYAGTPCTRCEVSGVEVRGGGNFHNYMIWNLRGRQIRIVNNVVDGGIPAYTPSFQEGIESFGGTDVLVAGNTVRNVGNFGLNFGSAGLADSGILRLTVTGNVVENVYRGVHMGTVVGPTGPQNVEEVRVENNTFRNVWHAGAYLEVAAGTRTRDVLIRRNLIEDVGAPGVQGRGVYIQGTAGTAADPASSSGVVVEENTIRDVPGTNAFGVLVLEIPNVRVSGNLVVGSGHTGIYALFADSLTVDGNTVQEPFYSGVATAQAPARAYVRDNTVWNWDRSGAGTAGIVVGDAASGEVRGNSFYHTPSALSPAALRVASTSANVVVAGNQLLNDWGAELPFVNSGANANTGTFTATAGLAVLTVPHPLAQPASQVTLLQTAGPAAPFTVQTGDGAFTVTFASPPTGAERFYFEIVP